jgi:hypothetical protein
VIFDFLYQRKQLVYLLVRCMFLILNMIAYAKCNYYAMQLHMYFVSFLFFCFKRSLYYFHHLLSQVKICTAVYMNNSTKSSFYIFSFTHPLHGSTTRMKTLALFAYVQLCFSVMVNAFILFIRLILAKKCVSIKLSCVIRKEEKQRGCVVLFNRARKM